MHVRTNTHARNKQSHWSTKNTFHVTKIGNWNGKNRGKTTTRNIENIHRINESFPSKKTESWKKEKQQNKSLSESQSDTIQVLAFDSWHIVIWYLLFASTLRLLSSKESLYWLHSVVFSFGCQITYRSIYVFYCVWYSWHLQWTNNESRKMEFKRNGFEVKGYDEWYSDSVMQLFCSLLE